MSWNSNYSRPPEQIRKQANTPRLSELATMQLLTENLERQVSSQVRKGLIVWLDKDGLYTDFVDQLAEKHAQGKFSAPVVGYRGSYLELLLALENLQDGLDSESLLLHIPGHTDISIRGTPLLEAYRSGTRFERALPTLIREVATGQVSAAEVERFVAQEELTLEKAEQWLQAHLAREQTGLAATLAHWKPEAVLCGLLMGSLKIPNEDCPILQDYAERHCGFSEEFLKAHLGPHATLTSRATVEAWVGWLLCVEYVNDLFRTPTVPLLQPLAKLSAPLRKACLQLLQVVRQQFPEEFRRLANQTEVLVEPDLLSGKPEELGKIDTFSREDSRLLEAAVACLKEEDWTRALDWAVTRMQSPSVWLEADPLRYQEWQLIKTSARLGQLISQNDQPLKGVQSLADALERYTKQTFQVDQAHRTFEQDRLRLLEPRLNHFDSIAEATNQLRRLYHVWVDGMTRAFTDLCVNHGFLPEASLQQRTLYEQVVHPLTQREGKIAYFLVDGLRFEMAAELAQRLEKPGLLMHLNARLAELPSITRVGMNALAPVSRQGNLKVDGSFDGFRAGEYVVRHPEQRLRAMGERSLESLPGGRRSPLGLTLRKVQTETPQNLKKSLNKSPLVVVHSREIDSAGESEIGVATFETWLNQLYAAIQLLRNAGVDQFVITSDHGFLLIDESREPIDIPGERRFLLSESPSNQSGTTASVATHSLAYEGMTGYILFPRDASTFRSRGNSAQTFVHGGNSLQERAIPVLTLSYKTRELVGLGQYVLEAEAQPTVLGHSRIRVRVREGESMMLGFENKTITLALRVVDPEGSNILASCKQVQGAVLQHQQLLVTVGADWAEVIFTLEGGNVARAAIEVYHPDGQEKIAAKRLAEFFEVRCESAPEPVVVNSAVWQDSIEDQEYRQIFVVISEEGSIDNERIILILGSQTAARKFARKFETYLDLLPFGIAIEAEGGLKRYVRKG